MWYYVLENKQNGPTDEAGIRTLLEAKTILPTTLVWQEGMTDWKSLNQTQLAHLLPPPAAPAPAAPATAASVPAPAPAAPAYPAYGQPYPQYTQYPQPVYQPYPQPYPQPYGATQLPGYPGYNPATAARINELDQLMTWFWICFGTGFFLAIPWIAMFVIYFIILYKCWQVVQDGYARTTPGQAVGFLFLPLFNLYWQFPALHGLAKDMNAFMARHGIYGQPAPEGLALATCITTCIPYVDIIVAPILSLVLIGQLKRTACSILSQTK